VRARGTYVYELVNEGAGMTGLRIGLVVRSGAKTYTVCWEGGFRSRYTQGNWHPVMTWKDWSHDEKARSIAQISNLHPGEAHP
jgi:hypothetical protein